MRNFVLKNNVREARLSLGLSQSALADRVGVSKNSISSIERGEYQPSAYTAMMLCICLGKEFSDLFYIE